MSKLLLFLDTETTGTSLAKSEVIQIAGVAFYNGEWAGTINLSAQPFSYDNINPRALEVCDISIEDLRGFKSPDAVFKKFVSSLTAIRDSIDPSLKFIPIAHNAPFDKRFVDKWWRNCSNACDEKLPKMHRLIDDNWVDSLVIARELVKSGIVKSENSKLETLAEHFGIKFDGRGAHDALSDTIVLHKVFFEMANVTNSALANGSKLNSKTLLEATGCLK